MTTKNFVFMVGVATALAVTSVISFAAEKGKTQDAGKSGADATFIKKAANGGMTEVELGKIAQGKAKKDDVKSFAERMVKDHGKANDDLKSVAAKMNVEVPDKVNAKHQAMIDKFSKMSAESFDAAYAQQMVKDHKTTVADFESAQNSVKNEDLKKFITDTLPTLKEHYEMAQKLEGAK
jgi:putative membrane protein